MSTTTDVPDLTDAEKEERAREDFADGLVLLAGFIATTPGAPLPPGPFVRHFADADAFDRAAEAIGASPAGPSSSGFEHANLHFGPVCYGVQTDGRAAQQIRQREAAIAERERELGIATGDVVGP